MWLSRTRWVGWITVTGLKTVPHDTGNDIIKAIITNDSARLLVNGGSSLTMNAAGSTNAGILQVGGISAGTLLFNGGSLANTAGELLAGSDGVIELNGVDLVDGELNSNGNGRFQASASSSNYLRGVTLNGLLDMATLSNSRQRVRDDMTLNGTIEIENKGILSSEGNGTMTSRQQVSGTGTLQVDSTGVMNLASLANAQGKLAMGAAGAVLNIGSSVTDGATSNATLTIGNIRVGDNTFNYLVANTGTTGPSLRGALQTDVNGGSITDGRLSGSGVTASNYNTGGPGSDTGNLAVVFNAATAGALAPLVDQKVNLRSNFENIVDQHLDIVLAGGAGAITQPAAMQGHLSRLPTSALVAPTVRQ